METITIYIGGAAHTMPYEAPRVLAAFLEPYGFPMPCGGAHTCGKCRVTAYGALSPLSKTEKRLLTVDEQLSNVRLACCAQALGGCTIHARAPENARVETAGLSAQRSDASPFGTQGYAFAVDIGTTTAAVYLVDLTRARPAEAASALNAQASYGADVIARIARCAESGVRPLQEAILGQLDGLFTVLLKRSGLDARVVRGVVLTGNTTMLHLAAGLDPAGIAAAPYTPQSLFGVMESARRLFAALPPDVPVYFAPCAGAYIGGDLICALLAAAPQENELLMDIGTNGELALITGTGILCCSTAAGPAFEGAGLSHGMVAADGAITDVSMTGKGAVCTVAGGGAARGLCGTGAISALAALLGCGAVDETGLLDEQYHEAFPLMDGVALTQADIRQLQLAKAAVAAGVDSMLQAAGLAPPDLRALLLAGGFGSRIDVRSAASIGLIPPVCAPCARACGNAAGAGACLIASSQSALDDAERLAKRAQVLDLTESAFFSDRFIEQMLFPLF
ncbi:ASKHA domain-containing protein [Anaerotruncus sp.]|uniref:ASKHA domain-containing protein n=1 Tax=Anaerotruncus TaxID=244127 RepID=UPI00216F66DA|nr:MULTISPECIES: ASKHA domain-containing protein [Anaerotruncus]MCI8492724.1 DUF4445 domain-containing protein [Anaerotruncus sp.]